MIYHNAPTPPGAPESECVNPIIYVTWFWSNKELVGHNGWLCLCHAYYLAVSRDPKSPIIGKLSHVELSLYMTSVLPFKMCWLLHVYVFKQIKKNGHARKLLHHTPHHPKHTFRGIVKSPMERFYRICNNKQDIDEPCPILLKGNQRQQKRFHQIYASTNYYQRSHQ